MAAHTLFPDNLGVVSHGAFTLLVDTASHKAALVDPADADVVIAALKQHSDVTLTHVLTTHKHWDHAQGNSAIKAAYPDVTVVGGAEDQVTACTLPVKQGDALTIGEAMHVSVLFTPCHTRGHVLYHVTAASASSAPQSQAAGAVFTGDTLFIAGCGRFFEGSAAQMHNNLNRVVASLPPSTAVYCGHEYTQANLEFAAWAEPGNADVSAKLRWAEERRRQRLSTLGTTVAEEQRINPFMRVGVKEIAQRVSRWIDKNVDGDEQVQVMAAVRQAKDQKAHKQSASL